jgi:hypothetical protein
MAFSITEIEEDIFGEGDELPPFVQVANEPSNHCIDAFATQGSYGLYNGTTFLALAIAEDAGIHSIS